MTQEQFQLLLRGDIIRHRDGQQLFVVDRKEGETVTLIATVPLDVSAIHHEDWVVVAGEKGEITL